MIVNNEGVVLRQFPGMSNELAVQYASLMSKLAVRARHVVRASLRPLPFLFRCATRLTTNPFTLYLCGLRFVTLTRRTTCSTCEYAPNDTR